MDLHQSGAFEKADKAYRSFLAAEPRHAQALTLLGTLNLQCGNRPEGIKLFILSLAIDPCQPAACINLGRAFKSLRRYEEALSYFDQAVALDPGCAESHYNRGGMLKKLERNDDAMAAFGTAIALHPGYAQAHNNRGNLLEKLKRYEEALRDYDEALAALPSSAIIYTNRANVLSQLRKYDEALADYARAIALDPAYAGAWSCRGSTLQELKRYDEAMVDYDQAITLDPEYAEARYNKGILAILRGQWEEGWKLYEWRWKTSGFKIAPRAFRKPLWLGREDIAGKTILLHAEQGMGDIILSCRYVPMVEALGAKVIIEVPNTLAGLISSVSRSARVIKRGSAWPAFDFHCPFMSLPHAFATTVTSVPSHTPYLWADANKQKRWKNQLAAKPGKKIGLVWAGSGKYANKADFRRDIPLATFLRIAETGHNFVSLQKDLRPGDAEQLASAQGIVRVDDALDDFSDTAALIAELDLVISVDTAVAHLAGALGKPVWILLPDPPDLFWMLEREDSLWYPTARLFRQPRMGDWESVIERVVAGLGK